MRGVVVRSELIGIEERGNGERVTIYTAGMLFKEGSTEKLADFLKPIEQHKKEAAPDIADKRLHVRFNITADREKILSYPAQFVVKAIGLGGMLIETNYSLEVERKIPMELSLNDDSSVNFIGRVVSSNAVSDEGAAHYEIGVEFSVLSDKDRLLLKTFIDYLSESEPNDEPA